MKKKLSLLSLITIITSNSVMADTYSKELNLGHGDPGSGASGSAVGSSN